MPERVAGAARAGPAASLTPRAGARQPPRVVRVSVEGVGKRYGSVEALRAVSLDFDAGRLTAILGPSGCGKTTLLRSIAGFVAVDAGSIRFDGADVTALPPQRRGTAMVFQSYALWPHMSVFDNVAYGLRLRKVPAPEIARRVREALALVEIGDVEATARRKPTALSGGQQQRVALARAVVVEPRVLLLDEPPQQPRRQDPPAAAGGGAAAAAPRRHHDDLRDPRPGGGPRHRRPRGADEPRRGGAGGTPEQVYLAPATEFVADFLGVGNRVEGRAEPGAVHVEGQRLPYGGAARGAVLVILRSSDLSLAPPAATSSDRPEGPGLAGQLEESLFLGAYYGTTCGWARPCSWWTGPRRPGRVPSPSPCRRTASACTRRPDRRRSPMLLRSILAVLLGPGGSRLGRHAAQRRDRRRRQRGRGAQDAARPRLPRDRPRRGPQRGGPPAPASRPAARSTPRSRRRPTQGASRGTSTWPWSAWRWPPRW